MTADIRRRLEALTLNLTRTEDVALISVAERLYAREKGLAAWREADALGERLPRMQAFARGLAWLRAHDPARHLRLARVVGRYALQARLLGASEGDVPPRYPLQGVLWYIVREAVVLGIGLPIALAALPFWYPPYALNRAVVHRLGIDETGTATYKLGLASVLMPLTLLAWTALAWLVFGTRAALLALVVLPPLGIVLHYWSGRWEKVREDTRLFLRVTRNPRARDRLAEQRARLVHEFDDVARLIGQTPE